MAIEIDLSESDKPLQYELYGGPYCGSTIQIATEIVDLEKPPLSITLESDEQDGRDNEIYRYLLDVLYESSEDGELIPRGLHYRFEDIKR